MQKAIFLTILFLFLNAQLMAQSDIIFQPSNAKIGYNNNKCEPAVQLLKKNSDKIVGFQFEITPEFNKIGINLKIINTGKNDYFEIISDDNQITLQATSPLFLEYAVTSLLEIWEVRKFTPEFTYYPKFETLKYPKNKKIHQEPSFGFRGILYPGSYDEAFRKWHKLDWYLDDFGLWAHTFHQLVPAKEYFKENPKMFALYENKRNPESICYSNDTVFSVLKENITQAIAKKPNAQYFSISQNDDVVYCECTDCQKLNQKYGSPQGAHYYFLNKIANQFPKTKIVTLAYLFSYQPPKNLELAPNLYPMFCPIEADRAEILNEGRNKAIGATLKKWTTLSKNVIVWDYTVQFSNYLSPFPNLHTFNSNCAFFDNSDVYGVFSQGYADISGSFSELRQYILAKLLWNSQTDVKKITADFLRGYYGKAAPFIKEYLSALAANQIKSNSYLDIYSGAVAARNSFLTPANMTVYDNLLQKAAEANKDSEIKKRIQKLRLDLEYVFFEQAKFYGKDLHGMYVKSGTTFVVKENLEQRVRDFVASCNAFGIYELSEGGLSPDQYLEQWLFISKNNVVDHLGEKVAMHYVTQPAPGFNGKKIKGLQDGVKGYNDFNINWTGWYGENAEIEIDCNKLDFSSLTFQCLEDQRHWIFLPQTIQIWGFKENKWTLIEQQKGQELTENYQVNPQNYNFDSISFCKFVKIKIILTQQPEIPSWRKRKNKLPMIMVDEIVLQKK